MIALLDVPSEIDREGTHISIGSLVKMATPNNAVFAMITGQSIPIPSQDGKKEELRICELELVGEMSLGDDGGIFSRGVSESPALGDPVYACGESDVTAVYAEPSAATRASSTTPASSLSASKYAATTDRQSAPSSSGIRFVSW